MRVIVIGGGPAGMMAAAAAAEKGHDVTLMEKNDKPGRKLYLTGKGRCNVTNASDITEIMARVNVNARFLYSALHRLGSGEVIRFFEENGVPLKTERGRRVFPVSDHSSDIVRALERYARARAVKMETGVLVLSVDANQAVRGVQTDKGFRPAGAVVVATGGLSYPSTGSTGDGYRFAKETGHTVTPLYPSLTSLKTAEPWVTSLAGLSLKNVRASLMVSGAKKPIYEETGEMLFTHDGVSGPIILSASRYVADRFDQNPRLCIDLKPALTHEMLDIRILRDFQTRVNKDFSHSLDDLLPKRLIDPTVALSQIPPSRKVNAVTKAERLRLGGLLKCLPLTPVSTGGYDEAVITMGGVNVREINPATMMSKKVKGLYFAGEVLDVDAMTGGYNLQIAFSTGYLAGISIGSE